MTIQETTFLFFSFCGRLQREMSLARCMLLFMLSILIGGCATPEKLNPTQEEQKSIQKVGLVVQPELDGIDLRVLGASTGAALGFTDGIIASTYTFPPGVIFLAPLGALAGAWSGAECQRELNSIENPEQHFQETVKRLELPSRLEKHVLDAFFSDTPPKGFYSIAAPNNLFVEVVPSLSQESRISYANSRGLDTLLELGIYVSLSATSVKIEGKNRCGPKLETTVVATLHRVSDGKILAKRSFNKTPHESLTFQKMLSDETTIVELIDYSLIYITKQIIMWILPSQQ
jgi:outer membrane lipoprotein SlyB